MVVWVPELEKVLLQVEPVPAQALAHVYVYAPVPPEGKTVKVVDWPMLTVLGEAEQETFKTGVFAGVGTPILKVLSLKS